MARSVFVVTCSRLPKFVCSVEQSYTNQATIEPTKGQYGTSCQHLPFDRISPQEDAFKGLSTPRNAAATQSLGPFRIHKARCWWIKHSSRRAVRTKETRRSRICHSTMASRRFQGNSKGVLLGILIQALSCKKLKMILA